MGATALVTGANGFVGSHLTDLLLERGWDVRCLVRRTSDLRWLPVDRVGIHYGEVTDAASLRGAFEGVEVVFHVAGVTRARDEERYLRVNAGGTRNVVERARREAPDLKRLLLVSSLAAGGPAPADRPRAESDPDAPVSAYGRSKKQGEEVLRETAGDLPWTIVRPPAVYGTRDYGFLILARMVSKGWVVRFLGHTQPVSVVHISDLVRGIVDAAASAASVRGTYYLNHPEITTWTEIGRLMARALGNRARDLIVPWPLIPLVGKVTRAFSRITGRPNPIPEDRLADLMARAWTCDPALAARDFGFRAEIGIARGVPEVMTWFRKEGWV